MLELVQRPEPVETTFNSAKVKPRPARTRRLYLMVGHLTIGLSLSTGRGATAAAFERRALRRLSFRPGYYMSEPATCSLDPRLYVPGRSELELVAANPFGNLSKISTTTPHQDLEEELTVVRYLLVVFDRHCYRCLSWSCPRGMLQCVVGEGISSTSGS
jgi:hypothetical protein